MEENDAVKAGCATGVSERGARPLTDAELMALAALAMRDVVEVLAANQDREDRGEAPAYDGVCSTACAALEAALCLRGVLEPRR